MDDRDRHTRRLPVTLARDLMPWPTRPSSRLLLVLIALGTACGRIGFEPSPADASAGCMRWVADFGSDPTTLDHNGDGVPDWHVRGGRAFPAGELMNGAWHASPGVTLDTHPRHPFDGHTAVHVRMRSRTGSSGTFGTVFWLNVNTRRPPFSAVFLSLAQEADGRQELRLHGKPAGDAHLVLATLSGLPDGFVDVRLEIDAPARMVGVRLDGRTELRVPFPPTGPAIADEWATVLAWQGSAGGIFDHVWVQACPGP